MGLCFFQSFGFSSFGTKPLISFVDCVLNLLVVWWNMPTRMFILHGESCCFLGQHTICASFRRSECVDFAASQERASKVSGHGAEGSARGEGSSGADAPGWRSTSSKTRTDYVAVSIVDDDDDNELHSLRVNKSDIEKLGFFDDDGVLKPGTFRCRFGEGGM